VSAIVAAAAAAGRVVKVVGAAHSPNDCAMSDDIMMSLSRLNRVLVVDAGARLVQAEAGCTLAALTAALDAAGLALPNLGSISDQTLAGCICTGTHGTGAGQGILSTHVVELQVVFADGSVHVLSPSRRPDVFRAALCSLGSLAVITGVVMSVVPAYDLHAVERPDTLSAVLSDLRPRVASAPLYRFWWFPHTDGVWEWRATPVPPRVHRPVRPTRWGLAALGWWARDTLAWVRDTVFGFHALQAALAAAAVLPRLVPPINALWRAIQFGAPRERIDRSDRVFNFNCLFKQ
jgi:L-gulonolactone oxidase